jgi:hypothetical protein
MSVLPNGKVCCAGLDYAGVSHGFGLSGIEPTPELWADIQMIERGAMCAMNED